MWGVDGCHLKADRRKGSGQVVQAVGHAMSAPSPHVHYTRCERAAVHHTRLPDRRGGIQMRCGSADGATVGREDVTVTTVGGRSAEGLHRTMYSIKIVQLY